MDTIARALRSPGARRELTGRAPTVLPPSHLSDKEVDDKSLSLSTDIQFGYQPTPKPRRLDRWLDNVVAASGTIPVFIFIQAGLLTWAFLGIPFHDSELWPVMISDIQAIFSYVFDSFLMRQQLSGYDEFLLVAVDLRSRTESLTRMLGNLVYSLTDEQVVSLSRSATTMSADKMSTPASELPTESRFTRCISFASKILGHIGFVIFFWAAMILWLCFGPANDWSTQWQLEINSATSALMVFTFSFIAILRERHAVFSRQCLDAIYRTDATLEMKLRELTSDDIPNSEVVVPSPKVNVLQRAINYYADIIGTLVGIAILLVFMTVWICIGPALQFNANWWLIIGTYAGLIGLFDGFVLRNIQARLTEHESEQFKGVAGADDALLTRLHIPTLPPAEKKFNATVRASRFMGMVCAHEFTVVFGFLLVVGLIVGASAMGWSITGQLLCNIPPSLVESFFMIVLITGHNMADGERREDLQAIHARRLQLLSFVEVFEQRRDSGKLTPTEKVVPKDVCLSS